jgi:hypothetical protein
VVVVVRTAFALRYYASLGLSIPLRRGSSNEKASKGLTRMFFPFAFHDGHGDGLLCCCKRFTYTRCVRKETPFGDERASVVPRGDRQSGVEMQRRYYSQTTSTYYYYKNLACQLSTIITLLARFA